MAAVDPGGQVMMVPLTAADLDRMAELVETYGDFPLGLVDAPVIAVAERLKADAIATLDHCHLSVVRPRHLPALKLLPGASDYEPSPRRSTRVLARRQTGFDLHGPDHLGLCQTDSSGMACKRPGVRVPLAPPTAPLREPARFR